MATLVIARPSASAGQSAQPIASSSSSSSSSMPTDDDAHVILGYN